MKRISIQIIIFVVIGVFAVLALILFALQKEETSSETFLPIAKDEKNKEGDFRQKEEVFVTDVDMNIDNWQTKETEFFTIKFPKEWYWMESDLEKDGCYSRVITNDPDFDIGKNACISIGGGIGQPMSLEGETEILITFSGIAVTSEVGTPEESIHWQIERAKEFLGSNVSCVYIEAESENNDPEAYCTAVNEKDQKVQAYYTLGKSFTYAFVMWTDIHNEVVKRDILERVAKSLIEKIEL